MRLLSAIVFLAGALLAASYVYTPSGMPQLLGPGAGGMGVAGGSGAAGSTRGPDAARPTAVTPAVAPLAGAVSPLTGAVSPLTGNADARDADSAPARRTTRVFSPTSPLFSLATTPSPADTAPSAWQAHVIPESAATAGGESNSAYEAQVALARAVQAELKRVGCYWGNVDGDWGPASKRAISTFLGRINATLPVDRPDHVLLTLVKGHVSQACGTTCAAGEVLSRDGRCISNVVVARKAPERAAPSTSGPTSPAQDVVAVAQQTPRAQHTARAMPVQDDTRSVAASSMAADGAARASAARARDIAMTKPIAETGRIEAIRPQRMNEPARVAEPVRKPVASSPVASSVVAAAPSPASAPAAAPVSAPAPGPASRPAHLPGRMAIGAPVPEVVLREPRDAGALASLPAITSAPVRVPLAAARRTSSEASGEPPRATTTQSAEQDRRRRTGRHARTRPAAVERPVQRAAREEREYRSAERRSYVKTHQGRVRRGSPQHNLMLSLGGVF